MLVWAVLVEVVVVELLLLQLVVVVEFGAGDVGAALVVGKATSHNVGKRSVLGGLPTGGFGLNWATVGLPSGFGLGLGCCCLGLPAGFAAGKTL